MKLKVWQTLLIVLVVSVFSALGFSGCGSSRDGMSLTIESSSITTDSEGREVVDLVKDYNDEGELADTAYAQISVKVENGDSSIDRTISAVSSSNSQVSAFVTYNSETGVSIVTLTAISPTATASSTYVTITSNEDSNVQQKIYVQVQEKATAMDYSDKANATLHSSTVADPDIINGFAIFKGEAFTFDTESLFNFEPNQAYVPNIVYMTSTSGTHIYQNGDTYLEGTSSSLTELTVSTYDLDDPSDTTFIKVFKLYIYNTISSSDISLNRIDEGNIEENVQSFDLINNHTSNLNEAELELVSNTYMNGLSYSCSLSDPDAEGSILEIGQSSSEPNKFTLRGFGKSVDGITITFSIYYTNIENSPVITKTLLVRVVDYPTAIEVNDTDQTYTLVLNNPTTQEGYYGYYLRGTLSSNYIYTLITLDNFSSLGITVGTTPCYSADDYELTVFDKYKEEAVNGAELQIILQEFSEGYGSYTLQIDTNNVSGDLQTLAENLIIKKGNVNYSLVTSMGDGTVQYPLLTFTSGDLLYLSTSANETGSLTIIITAINSVDSNNPLTRSMVLNFTAGITSLKVQSGTLTTENKLLMEIGESGAENDNNERKVYLDISPTGAEIAELSDGSIGCYISAVSSNASIATVSNVTPSTENENAYLIVTAQGVGSTTITLTTANGLKVTFTAVVTPLLNTITLSLATSSQSSTTSTTTKTDAVNTTKTTIDTLTVQTGQTITLRYNIYPSTAYLSTKAVFTIGSLNGDEIEDTGVVITSSTSSVLTVGDVDKKSAWLSSKSQGTQYIVMTAKYKSLNEERTALIEKTIIQTFKVIVYQPINSVTVSTNKIQLLEGSSTGYYNQLQQTEDVTIYVGPDNSTVKASSTIWSIKTGGSSYISIAPTDYSGGTLVSGNVVGPQVTITSKNFVSEETTKSVQVQALLTDVNGKVWEVVINITVVKQVPVGNITVGSYNEDEGYYFEETGGLSTLPIENTAIVDRLAVMNSEAEANDTISQYQLLNVSVQYLVDIPTNTNLEYFLFNATVDEDNNWAVNGDKIRNYSSSNIWLGYDESSSKYFITPISAGYTIIYIIPQDKLGTSSGEITSVSDLIGKGGAVLHITVADGYVTYYRLYDANDVAEVSNNSSVWDRNYYIMNDIDMSVYCSGHYWTPIGNTTTSFTGTISSFDNAQHTLYGIDLKTRDNINTGDNGDFGSYYGFFGVIGTGTSTYKGSIIDCVGTIENVNFEFMSLEIQGTVTSANSYIGTLAGMLDSGAILNNVAVVSDNVTINVQASSSRTLYVGTIGENNSGVTETTNNIQNLDTQYSLEILSTNSSKAIIIFGGAIASNTATLAGSVTAYSLVNTADSACASSSSTFGGAVGQTTASMSNITSSGSITISDQIKANAVGGIVGTSRSTLSNCVSSVIAGSAYDVGGIVGIITDSASIVNCSYEIYEMSNASALYSNLSYDGRMINVGGIAGNGTNISLNYCYVISFLSTQLQELTSTYNVGGLVGRLNITTTANVQRSFFNGSIYANGNNATGGLVGYVAGVGTVQISNTFVNGNINSTGASNGLFIGAIASGTVGLQTSYSVASINGEFDTVGNGSATLANVFVLEYADGSNDESWVSYGTSAEMKEQVTFTNFDFSSTWTLPSNEQVNNGYPILRSTDGILYPTIPTSMDFSAKENVNANVYNTSDSRHIIIKLKGLTSSELSLLDLFDVTVAPTQANNGDLKVSIITSNSNVIDITYGTKLEDFRIKIVGVGTATLTITSLYNSSVYETIGIAVVNGYSDVKLYLSEEEKDEQEAQSGDLQIIYNVETTNPLTDVSLQIKNSEEWYIDYDTDATVGALGGGVAFVVEDGYLAVGTNNLASVTMTTEQFLQKCLNIGLDNGTYALSVVQRAFRLLTGDDNATVVQDGDNYIFTMNSTVLGTIGTDYYNGSTANVTLKRSKLISLCNALAFEGSDIYSVNIDDITFNDMESCLVKASNIFAQFYTTSSVTLEIIQDTPYIMYTVNGYSYARCSQKGSVGNYVLYTEVYMYVENSNYATVVASLRNTGLAVNVVPYVKGLFNTTTGKIINSTTETNLSFIWNDAITFNLIIYNGATDLYTTLGGTVSNPTELEISQDISFDIVLVSDSPLDQENGSIITIEEQEEDDTWAQVATQTISKVDGVWSTTTNIENAYRTQYNFSISDPTVSDGQISQNLVFGVLDSYKSEFDQSKIYRITISNNQFVTGSNVKTKVVYFKFSPQGVTYIDVTHYADAELEGDSGTTAGNYLTNAGAQPTDTILAGEMGLLRINLAPNYAQFDSITVTSNTVSGDLVSFQQRVAKTNVVNGENQTGYYFYETGVSYLTNGIIVAPVSNYDGSFDGTIWLQTLIAKQATLASNFLITITISRAGYDDFVYVYTLSVDSTSNIVLSYDGTLDADTLTPKAYIAVGTGGLDQDTVNQNLFTITTTGSFESISVPTIIDDTTGGKVVISSANDKYYIIVNDDAEIGSTFTLQVQGVKYINGYRRTITRYMYFTVTDFVLKNGSLTISGVSASALDKPYYQNAYYKLTIGYDEDSINANLTIASVKTALDNFIKQLNDGSIDVWAILEDDNNLVSIQAPNTNATYVYAVTSRLADSVTEKTSSTSSEVTNVYTAINNDYYIRLVTTDGDNNGWYICPLKQSTGDILTFISIDYIFSHGVATTNLGSANSYFTILQQDITLSFTQQTSLDSPIPIYTLAQLIAMEEGKDYRLMADIDTGTVWIPLDTAISSLDGNGHIITIHSFDSTTVGTLNTPANFGLFGTVDETTILKNITIQYGLTSNTWTMDLITSAAVNFGGIAGTNNGVITNCLVQGYNNGSKSSITISSSGTLTDVFNISGFVGVNNGSISNSRVTYLQLSGKGTLAGFVARNNSEIASSYVNYGTLINTATSNDVGATGGFVAYNSGKASVKTCYVGGTYAKGDNETYSIDTSIGVRGRTQQITSTVNTGGFVYSNSGDIQDSFCGVSLSVDADNQLGSVSGGFVYANKTGGEITRCYSVSYAPLSNKAHTPFVGPNSTYDALNNEDEGSITSCYYYDVGFGKQSITMTTALGIESLTLKQFMNEDNEQISFWQDYSTSRSYSEGSVSGEEFTSVWTFLNDHNAYFNIDNFLSTQVDGTTYFMLGPRLVGADTVAVENWETVSYNETTETYTYGRGSVTINDENYAVTSYLTLDASNNTYVVSPYLIDSAETLYNTMMNEINSTGKIAGWYRLISDIDLSDLVTAGYDLTNINQATFCGNLEGNGFTIENLDISSGTAENFGLFAEINSDDSYVNNFVSIQNLSIEVNDIAAALVSKVGTLAGSAKDVVLSNINVYSNSSALIIGKNMVGGVVGKISGSSRVSNISSSISVSAVYGNSTTNTAIYNADLWRLYESDGLSSTNGSTVLTNADSVLCYAGGIFGVADLQAFVEDNLSITEEEYNEARISNLTVTGQSKVVGTTSGGVIGLMGSSTFATNIVKKAESGAYLKGSRYVGGIVGENHGYLNYARLVYSDTIQTLVDSSIYVGSVATGSDFAFYQGTSKAIGGVVGLNIGLLYSIQTGIIENSYDTVNVKNTSAKVAGGLVGISAGGELTDCYVTGSVLSSRSGTTGGVIGVVCSLSYISVDVKDPFANASEKTSYIGMSTTEQFTIINYVVARNNWLYTDYTALSNTKADGQLGGFIGYIYNNKISTDNISYTNAQYATLVSEGNIDSSSETNFYVSTIYNIQPSKKTEATGGLTINAVGAGSTADVAKGLTRYEMYTYSYEKTQSNTDENAKVDRMFENWQIYSYGTEIDTTTQTFKIINYDTAGMPIYNPQPNPSEIEIWNIEDFNNIKDAPSANYILMADLDFTGVDFIPVGTASNPFTGTFTGTSIDTATDEEITHVFSNITMEDNTDGTTYNSSAVGVFAYTDGATIQDLVVVGINLSWEPSLVNATSFAGLLIGSAIDTNISNVQIMESYTRGETTWTGQNLLSTSAKYVGGAIGQASISVSRTVTMEQTFVEADIEVKNIKSQDINIGEDNEFTLEGATYFIVGSSINNVDGDNLTTISGNIFSLNGFNCVINSGAGTITCTAIQSPKVFVGGFVGSASIISGREMNITQSYFQGNISITRQSAIVAGGFVGESNNANYYAVFADTPSFAISNVGFISEIGGFAGTLASSKVEYATVSGDCSIGMASNEKTFYIGGFAGKISGASQDQGTVLNSTTSLNIYFTSSDNWEVTNGGDEDSQMIGGFAGSLGTNKDALSLKNICSTTTIYNSTFFENVDGFAYETPTNLKINNNNILNVYFDEYLSLVSRDINNFGVTGSSLVQGSVVFTKLDSTEYSKLQVGGGLYPRIIISGRSDISGAYQSKYYDLYEYTDNVNSNVTLGSKLNPVKISSANIFNNITSADYKWYLQTVDLDGISLLSSLSFNGFYNGSGRTITTTTYDSIYGSSQTIQDMGIFKIITSGSVLSGVEVDTMARVGLEADNGRTNIGVLSATVASGGIVFGCYTTGEIVITSTQQTNNVIGGLVANNSGQILASSSIVDITINAGTGKYFAVGGLVGYNANTINKYALKDCYYTGTIKNNISSSSQTFVGGIVGKVVLDVSANINTSSLASFVIADVYSVAKIYGNGGQIVGAWNSGSNLIKNVYYADIGTSQQTGNAIGTTFSILSQRVGTDAWNNSYDITNGITYEDNSSTTSMTSGIWTSANNYNYGLPYLKYQISVNDTGNGTTANPFLINNEGQLAWALSTSEVNMSYKLESDMDYATLSEVTTSSNLTFNGTLLGSGYYISNSTSALVAINNGTITQVGFKATSMTTNIIATINTGSISEIYVEQSGGLSLLSSGGTIKNCLTTDNSIDKYGDAYTLAVKNYSDILLNDNYDFMSTWVLQSTSSGASTPLTTGTLMLQAFVDSLGDIDVSGTTGSVTEDEGTYTLTITSKEQYTALLQYIARSGENSETYNVTLGADIDMTGMIVPQLLDNKEINLNLYGSGHTIYNLIINNQDSNSSLIGNLTSGFRITNLTLNQVNYITNANGGILVDNNDGLIQNVIVTNSFINSGGENNEYIGGIVGENNNIVSDISVGTLTIIANGGYVGGIVGVNNGEIDVSTVLALTIQQGTSNIDGIGGVAGHCASSSSVINVSGDIELTVGEGNSDIGGIIGYATQAGTVNVSGDITLTTGAENTNIGGVIGNLYASSTYTVNICSAVNIVVLDGSSYVGGIVGYTANIGAMSIFTSIDTEEAVINITATDSSGVGGIIGNNTKSDIVIKQNTTAEDFTTAITITLNHNGSNPTANNNNIGGMFGLNSASNLTINYNGSSTGINITAQQGDTNIGGVIGTNANVLQVTYLSGVTITGNITNVGGVAGTNTGTISGTVSAITLGDATYNGSSNVGGVVGQNSGIINKTTITAIIIIGQTNIGGIVGYNTGSVGRTGESYQSTITNISVVGNSNVGAILGVNEVPNNEGVVQNIKVSDSEGNNVLVTYLDTDNDSQAVGFAMAYNSGTVKDLEIDIAQAGSGLNLDALTDTQNNIGIIAGSNSGSLTSSAVQNYKLTTKSNSHNVGTIGTNSGAINGISLNNVTVLNGIQNIGMVVGYNTSTANAYDISVIYSTPTTVYLQDGALNIGGAVGYNAGIIAGVLVQNNLTIEGTQNSESTAISANNIGGAVGYNTGTITYTTGLVELENIVDDITVNGINNIGGFVGYSSGTVTLTSSSTTFIVTNTVVNGTQYVGGFVGYNSGFISGQNTNSIEVSGCTISGSTYVGGFAGTNATNAGINNEGLIYVTVSSCTVSSNMVEDSSSARVGGIAGSSASRIENGLVYSSNVKAQDGLYYGNAVGGVAGVNTGSITNTNVQLSMENIILGNDNVGGIVGSNIGTISNTSVTKITLLSSATVISGHGVNIGGIAGYNTGTITSTAGNKTIIGEKVKIEGVGIIGGIVGKNSGTISGTISMNGIIAGNPIVNSYVLGGVAGLNTGTINATITLGYTTSILGGILIGGVVGLNQDLGSLSNATVTFEVNSADASDTVTIMYYGANVYEYGVDEHNNDYTDKKTTGTQYWFIGTTITSGDLYCIGVGYIIGANANSATLCSFEETGYSIITPLPTIRDDYNGKYLRSGSGIDGDPYIYTLIDSNTSGITAGTTACYEIVPSVTMEQSGNGVIISANNTNVGV